VQGKKRVPARRNARRGGQRKKRVARKGQIISSSQKEKKKLKNNATGHEKSRKEKKGAPPRSISRKKPIEGSLKEDVTGGQPFANELKKGTRLRYFFSDRVGKRKKDRKKSLKGQEWGRKA